MTADDQDRLTRKLAPIRALAEAEDWTVDERPILLDEPLPARQLTGVRGDWAFGIAYAVNDETGRPFALCYDGKRGQVFVLTHECGLLWTSATRGFRQGLIDPAGWTGHDDERTTR